MVDYFTPNGDVVNIEVCFGDVGWVADGGCYEKVEIGVRIEGMFASAYDERDVGPIIAFVHEPPLCV